jgi:hypothetical protein
MVEVQVDVGIWVGVGAIDRTDGPSREHDQAGKHAPPAAFDHQDLERALTGPENYDTGGSAGLRG